MDDRRIFERFAINMPARFLDLDSGREGLAQTQDISAKGIGLVTNEEVKPNSNLEIWLQVPDKGEPLYTRGQVVWQKSDGMNNCRLGLNLEKADLMGMSRLLRM